MNYLSYKQFQYLKAAQMEAAQVWNCCMEMHKAARLAHLPWPERDALQKATKGRFALHSQSVQMMVAAFLANVQTTRHLRQTHPQMKMKYLWRTKRFYPVKWPAQAVSKEHRRVVLPMGKGRPSLVLPIALPQHSGACSLVWNNGFELHVCVERPQAAEAPGTVAATVDLGEIHLATVTTTTSEALIVTGRGIRSLKRQRQQQLGKIAKKQSRCQKSSRRWKRLQRAKNKQCRRAERRIRDLRHKATCKVIDFCVQHHVGTLFIGNPHGVRDKKSGRHHNQRMALWEYGKDRDYLTHKAKAAHIMSFTGSERGTSSQCPVCGHTHKPKGRNWACRVCQFSGHRDLVGSINMHRLAYETQVKFPRSFTYLRPGPSRSRSSRADTPQRCLSKTEAQPRLAQTVSSETDHPSELA
ncbi:transposase [Ktedonobacter sp. SOSP1-52]|uniref:RNA-guided endonuclease InsQ/TnpB family protein n=1 Tax=Ktedonobacter sp. SOSP1-52 TaxID=2778366 RepID=UPI0021050D75|nr:transposase [Ktedonobacter sp. SOSP1-52]